MATRSGKSSRSPRSNPRVAGQQAKRGIARRLAEVRGSRSQRAFARELGVFQQNVNRYESGTTPHADFLITLALREDVSLDWLLLGRGSRELK